MKISSKMHLSHFQVWVLQESHLNGTACQNIVHFPAVFLTFGAAGHSSGLPQTIQLISEQFANDFQILMAMRFSSMFFLAQHMQGHSAAKATKGSHFGGFIHSRGLKQCPGIMETLPHWHVDPKANTKRGNGDYKKTLAIQKCIKCTQVALLHPLSPSS